MNVYEDIRTGEGRPFGQLYGFCSVLSESCTRRFWPDFESYQTLVPVIIFPDLCSQIWSGRLPSRKRVVRKRRPSRVITSVRRHVTALRNFPSDGKPRP